MYFAGSILFFRVALTIPYLYFNYSLSVLRILMGMKTYLFIKKRLVQQTKAWEARQ